MKIGFASLVGVEPMPFADLVAWAGANGLDTIEVNVGSGYRPIAGASYGGHLDLADIVRVHYYVTDPAFVDVVFPILGGYFGDIRPAATMIVCGLAKPEMKIEIEATALRRTAP